MKHTPPTTPPIIALFSELVRPVEGADVGSGVGVWLTVTVAKPVDDGLELSSVQLSWHPPLQLWKVSRSRFRRFEEHTIRSLCHKN